MSILKFYYCLLLLLFNLLLHLLFFLGLGKICKGTKLCLVPGWSQNLSRTSLKKGHHPETSTAEHSHGKRESVFKSMV